MKSAHSTDHKPENCKEVCIYGADLRNRASPKNKHMERDLFSKTKHMGFDLGVIHN